MSNAKIEAMNTYRTGVLDDISNSASVTLAEYLKDREAGIHRRYVVISPVAEWYGEGRLVDQELGLYKYPLFICEWIRKNIPLSSDCGWVNLSSHVITRTQHRWAYTGDDAGERKNRIEAGFLQHISAMYSIRKDDEYEFKVIVSEGLTSKRIMTIKDDTAELKSVDGTQVLEKWNRCVENGEYTWKLIHKLGLRVPNKPNLLVAPTFMGCVKNFQNSLFREAPKNIDDAQYSDFVGHVSHHNRLFLNKHLYLVNKRHATDQQVAEKVVEFNNALVAAYTATPFISAVCIQEIKDVVVAAQKFFSGYILDNQLETVDMTPVSEREEADKLLSTLM